MNSSFFQLQPNVVTKVNILDVTPIAEAFQAWQPQLEPNTDLNKRSTDQHPQHAAVARELGKTHNEAS
jgi:hypothetical protein